MRTSQRDVSKELNAMLESSEALMLTQLCDSDHERLNTLMQYHLASGGSRTRARLAIQAGNSIGLDAQTCTSLAACCELVHNASLLHDDIQDGDRQRRGREAAWSLFDINTAMCAGTLMLSTAFSVISLIKQPTGLLTTHLHQRIADLICGQTLDLACTAQSIDMQTYLNIATRKSGSLLALPLELVMIAAQDHEAVPVAKAAGESFAVAYQIADDCQDVSQDLARGHCNIIGLMKSAGVSTTHATTEALSLAQHYLAQAERHAADLPDDSGALLINLCNQLRMNILSEGRLDCETV